MYIRMNTMWNSPSIKDNLKDAWIKSQKKNLSGLPLTLSTRRNGKKATNIGDKPAVSQLVVGKQDFCFTDNISVG